MLPTEFLPLPGDSAFLTPSSTVSKAKGIFARVNTAKWGPPSICISLYPCGQVISDCQVNLPVRLIGFFSQVLRVWDKHWPLGHRNMPRPFWCLGYFLTNQVNHVDNDWAKSYTELSKTILHRGGNSQPEQTFRGPFQTHPLNPWHQFVVYFGHAFTPGGETKTSCLHLIQPYRESNPQPQSRL